jgi:Ca2+-binding EF-hand superfamily protein
MGSAASRVVLPPLEVRVNKCMKFYRIKEAEVKRFYYIFTRLDKNLSGVIDIADFFKFLHEPRSIVGDTIFELVDCRSTIAITFTEFFYAVLTYCFFEVEEVLRFIFFIFDRDKNGYIDHDEFMFIVKIIHGLGPDEAFKGNVKIMMEYLQKELNPDGKVDFKEFKAFHKQFPALFHPAFRIQLELIRRTMGERWWAKMKVQHQNRKEWAKSVEKRRQRSERARTMRLDNRKVRKRMGFWRYYCCFWQRDGIRREMGLKQLFVDEKEEAEKERLRREAELREQRRKQKEAEEMKQRNPVTEPWMEYLVKKNHRVRREEERSALMRKGVIQKPRRRINEEERDERRERRREADKKKAEDPTQAIFTAHLARSERGRASGGSSSGGRGGDLKYGTLPPLRVTARARPETHDGDDDDDDEDSYDDPNPNPYGKKKKKEKKQRKKDKENHHHHHNHHHNH